MRIHIKTTNDVDDNIISELMNVLIKYKFEVQKYLVPTGKAVMGIKERQQ